MGWHSSSNSLPLRQLLIQDFDLPYLFQDRRIVP